MTGALVGLPIGCAGTPGGPKWARTPFAFGLGRPYNLWE